MEISDLLGVPGVVPALRPSGVDDTVGITSAMATNAHVVLAPGNYTVAGLTIPKNTTLHLMKGAILNTSQPINVMADCCGIVGNFRGTNFRQPSVFNYNIKWTGPPNSIVLKFGAFDSSGIGGFGGFLEGVGIWGNGIAGLTGIQIGNWDGGGNGGAVFGRFTHVGIFDTQVGLNVFSGCQQMWFENLHILNNIPSTGAAISLASTGSHGGLTALWFNQGTISGFRTWVQGGGIGTFETGGGPPASFSQYVFQGQPNDGTGIGLNLIRGTQYEFHRCYFEGPGNATLAQIGSADGTTTAVSSVQFVGGIMGGFQNFFKLYGFRGFGVQSTWIDASGGAYTVVSNYAASAKQEGVWLPGRVILGLTGTEFASGDGVAFARAGFEFRRRTNYAIVRGNQQNNPVLDHNLNSPVINVNAAVTQQLFPNNVRGLVLISDNSNRMCLFTMNGVPASATNVHKVGDSSDFDNNAIWSSTQNNANTYNLYNDTVNGAIVLQNNTLNAAQFTWSFWGLGEQGS